MTVSKTWGGTLAFVSQIACKLRTCPGGVPTLLAMTNLARMRCSTNRVRFTSLATMVSLSALLFTTAAQARQNI